MIDTKKIDPLIADEYEAIDGYEKYLSSIKGTAEFGSISKVIQEIIGDERDHIKRLNELKKSARGYMNY